MSSSGEPAPLRGEISSNHRRVISVRIRVLREACLKLLELSRSDDPGILPRTPIAAEEADQVRRVVHELNSLLIRITSDLALEEHPVDARREAAAILSGMVVDMEELNPRFLRGYGKITPSLGKYLATRMKQCLQVVERMRIVLAGSHESGLAGKS